MNNEQNLSELFDRYLENDLNILEKQAFELRLKEDQVFADRFRLHKEVDKALIEDDILNFRLQLEKIGTEHSEVQSVPMVIAEELPPEVDQAILEQDIMALRDQLNKIHSAVIEDVDPLEIPAYVSVERAIINQDPLELNKELEDLEEVSLANMNVQNQAFSQLSKDIDRAIMQEDIITLRKTLGELGETMAPSKKTKTLRKKVVSIAYSSAAAVLALLVVGTFYLNRSSAIRTSDRAFSQYFQSYDGIGNKRGPSENGNRIIELGIQKYNKGDYASALELFEACLSDESRTETILLYAGSSALMTGDPDKALRYFANWDESSPVYDQVEWYTAGCYMKKGDIDKTKAIIKKISEDTEHTYYNEAKGLLKKIEKEN